MRAVTVSEALAAACRPSRSTTSFPGSWINANFDVWIGAEEDNKAWAQLLRARATYDARHRRPGGAAAAGVRRTADRRGQRLVLVVRAGARFRQPRRVRPALSQPSGERLPLSESDAARGAVAADSASRRAGSPRRALRRRSGRDRWRGDLVLRVAGRRASTASTSGRVDARQEVSGAAKCMFGSDGANLFLRLDFHPGHEQELAGMEARITVQSLNGAGEKPVSIRFAGGARRGATARRMRVSADSGGADSRVWVGIAENAGVRFQFSIWQGGLPIDAVPQQGWLDLPPRTRRKSDSRS